MKLSEDAIIRQFQRMLGNPLFHPEDAESFTLGGKRMVAKTDTFVAGTDMPKGMSLVDAARKSMVACVSDLAAKGCRPEYAMISASLPRDTTQKQLRQMATGFRQACKEYGMRFLGGDTNEGKELVLNVCLFGSGDAFVRRRGARNGDRIFVTGPFGYTAIGLERMLAENVTGGATVRRAVRAFARPRPRLEFGVRAARHFSSSMDSSDGLAITLNEMARQSQKRFVITRDPTDDGLIRYARRNRKPFVDMMFFGGEEYEFAFTVRESDVPKVERLARVTGTPIINIGYVERGSRVRIQIDDVDLLLQDRGWRHFG